MCPRAHSACKPKTESETLRLNQRLVEYVWDPHRDILVPNNPFTGFTLPAEKCDFKAEGWKAEWLLPRIEDAGAEEC